MEQIKKVRPITELRDTNSISNDAHNINEPIFITKNGYDDLVVMSNDTYNKINKNNTTNKYPNQSNCYGMIRVACATNEIVVASPTENAKQIIKIIDDNAQNNLDILVFPELALTGYSCGDLFFFDSLLQSSYYYLDVIRNHLKGNHTLVFVGAPIEHQDKLYNCAIAICDGKFLGIIPKSNLPGYGEFYEPRQFYEYHDENTTVILNGVEVPFGTKLIFTNKYQLNLRVSCEICEDLWATSTPSTGHALAGANVIVNLSASNELFGKADLRRQLIKYSSSRLICAYIYASSGSGESTQDIVYSGHNIIAENGVILEESKLFENQTIITEIDLDAINASRRRNSSFRLNNADKYQVIYFEKKLNVKNELFRKINPYPFLPSHEKEALQYANEIIRLQTMGLVKRLKHLKCKDVVIGISGGLDSSLALIVIQEAFKRLNLSNEGIHTLLLPCFGTTSRTFNNSKKLCELFNTNIKVVDITDSVNQHLKDIGNDKKDNIAFENAQARERTQVLFDYANLVNGFVVGTGDLSELALGWCTYNGDHMSNYSVNASVSKTLVRFLIKAYADTHDDLKEVLYDILETPISPELLPSLNGKITQETEKIIGPYVLHDFFLYNLLKYNYDSGKLYYFSTIAFKNVYDSQTIKKWLNIFIKRFFSQQFKRSCLPDGPKVTEISLSPRGDLRMPSDASCEDFLIK